MIASRHCLGVEAQDVTNRLSEQDESAHAGCEREATNAHNGGWFYWVGGGGDDGEGGGEGVGALPGGLVSWAMEDESGGVGLVYTVGGWRRKGLGRWALAGDSGRGDQYS